jgi:hypothetical protein
MKLKIGIKLHEFWCLYVWGLFSSEKCHVRRVWVLLVHGGVHERTRVYFLRALPQYRLPPCLFSLAQIYVYRILQVPPSSPAIPV